MAWGRFLLASQLSIWTFALMPALVRAEDAPPLADLDPSHMYPGVVNASAVYVRTRPSADDGYATQKLARGAKVTVIGMKGNWLQILPPEGSFAYVPKMRVNADHDGTVGHAQTEVLARAGSDITDLASQTLCVIHANEEVQIIGQHNEYFKIKPPKGTYLWISKQFVDRVIEPQQEKTDPPIARADGAGHPDNTASKPEDTDAGPTTQPGDSAIAGNDQAAPAPATQPGNSVAEYEKLEKQFADANNKSVLDQPLPEMLAGYQKVIDSDDLPDSMRRIAQARLAALKVRNEARQKFLAAKQEQQKFAEKQKSLVAERQEIEDRIKKNDVQLFAAVGTLRTSSLQMGPSGTLYRLTDPATGRTVAYLRTNDSKYAQLLGQFIGVKGTVTSDPQLKSIIQNPTEAKPIEKEKVNVSIAAQLVPPSLAMNRPPAPAPAPVNTDSEKTEKDDKSASAGGEASTNDHNDQ